MRRAWLLLKTATLNFIADDALSRGAAIAYYTIFSIGPVLLIVVAMVGVFFGRAAAQGAVMNQLSGLMGEQSAAAIQSMIQSADRTGASIVATVVGLVTLLIAASGVFSEMQAALNVIWRAQSTAGTVTRLLRARAASLGLVAAMGFLLLVSLVVTAAIAATGKYLGDVVPEIGLAIRLANLAISYLLVTAMFAAIYKILPDRDITWRDVGIGAAATAVLFTVGKTLIGLYLGRSSVASSYGAAGSLLVILLWIYYSAQIFLFGAEFTKVYAEQHGSLRILAGTGPALVGHAELDRLRDALHQESAKAPAAP